MRMLLLGECVRGIDEAWAAIGELDRMRRSFAYGTDGAVVVPLSIPPEARLDESVADYPVRMSVVTTAGVEVSSLWVDWRADPPLALDEVREACRYLADEKVEAVFANPVSFIDKRHYFLALKGDAAPA